MILTWTSLFSFGGMRSIVFGSNSTFQPLGAEPDNSTASAGAVPVLVTMTGIVVSWPAVALALSRPSRPASSIFGVPVMSRPSSAVAVASSAVARAVTLCWPTPIVFGGRTLSLTSFDWPASSGTRVELLAAVLLGEGDVEVRRRGCAARFATIRLPLSFLIVS